MLGLAAGGEAHASSMILSGAFGKLPGVFALEATNLLPPGCASAKRRYVVHRPISAGSSSRVRQLRFSARRGCGTIGDTLGMTIHFYAASSPNKYIR